MVNTVRMVTVKAILKRDQQGSTGGYAHVPNNHLESQGQGWRGASKSLTLPRMWLFMGWEEGAWSTHTHLQGSFTLTFPHLL